MLITLYTPRWKFQNASSCSYQQDPSLSLFTLEFASPFIFLRFCPSGSSSILLLVLDREEGAVRLRAALFNDFYVRNSWQRRERANEAASQRPSLPGHSIMGWSSRDAGSRNTTVPKWLLIAFHLVDCTPSFQASTCWFLGTLSNCINWQDDKTISKIYVARKVLGVSLAARASLEMFLWIRLYRSFGYQSSRLSQVYPKSFNWGGKITRATIDSAVPWRQLFGKLFQPEHNGTDELRWKRCLASLVQTSFFRVLTTFGGCSFL